MIPLQGEHICRVDAKGRFMLPVALKNQVSTLLSEGFVVKRSIFSPCLELYPRSNWDELYLRIMSKMNRFNKKHNDFIRAYNAGLKELEIDGTGRILIPKDLAVFAEITGDIVVTAKMDCIEIWDKARYDTVVSETQTNFPDLAEEILGNINLNE
ncbi:MAG: division/cell wall cluster transcriptional repressor MraZ [Bacteroidota bacterium]